MLAAWVQPATRQQQRALLDWGRYSNRRPLVLRVCNREQQHVRCPQLHSKVPCCCHTLCQVRTGSSSIRSSMTVKPSYRRTSFLLEAASRLHPE